ncbi:MAG: hybrid sensor histidine kinase/response regulator [Gammaproteobacteria bacterium]
MAEAADCLSMTGTFHLPQVDDLPSALAKITILIVDDDEAFRYLCASVLRNDKQHSYTVIEAGTYHEAVQKFDPDTVDCVLADYNLAGFTGHQFMDHIHAIYPNWFGPVVVITAAGSEELAADVMRAGAADYISKQTSTNSTISRAMTNALEKAKLKRAIFERNVDLEKANDKLERRNSEIARFYHRVSHEIKTPLTAAQMLISMVHGGLAGEITEQQHELIGQALESCGELTMLFNDLVECTRLDAGKLRIERKLARIEPCIRRGVLSVSPVAENKSIEIETEIADDLPELLIDAGRIVQVVGNLLGNAVKFTDSGGRVSVQVARSTRQSRTVDIVVSDNGCGIAAADRAKVFDRLYQVDDVGNATAGAGLGLGLTISAELVALHDGKINVDSELGLGSAFTVSIPIPDVHDVMRGNAQ